MKIAAIQMCSAYDPKANIEKINTLIAMAKAQALVEAVFLPEVFYSISDGLKATEHLVAEGNQHFQAIANIAKQNQVYLIGGSAATNMNGKVLNRTYNFDPAGKALPNYDKNNLFRVDLTGTATSTVIDESKIFTAGKQPQMVELGPWKVGLGICFDVRFPELFRGYFAQGANLMTISAAFTVPTGKAHWETLIRARAIENQSYVIAAAQWGTHNERIKTYGHSMIVDPWGEVLANAGEGEGYILGELDLEAVQKVRGRMNVFPKG